MRSTDTIFALSTGRLPSGIAIVRMSGPGVRTALEAVAGAVPPRVARYGPLSFRGELLDHGLSLFFPGPASVTGEDCGEFHVHGSVAVVKGLITALSSLDGFRLAEPGEFSRRGFLNGRMDLTAVESLSDLIAAETDQQRKLALAGMGGKLRDIFLEWRAELQSLRARIEAELDFSDQDDVSPDLNAAIGREIDSLTIRMDRLVGRLGQAELVRDGYRVAILGAPNAGKSSLLNVLAMRDVAIVSNEAGTTRDLVEVSLEIDGFKVILTDTAGIRETKGVVEAIGIERALEAARLADLVILLEDTTNPVPITVESAATLLRVGAKSDLAGSARGDYDVLVSSLTGDGIRELLSKIGDRIRLAVSDGDGLLALRERHVGHLNRARAALQRASKANLPELVAEELRVAAVEIGRIVGIGDTEDLLGEIFSRFCIGK
ncbi:tRNA uridine-5-carboxymethylaminomethyl(34) synthesis GTPase MnmE [Mesorhizobium australicum]|uniref:tRNA modification GTPase MnmE n=1 Tax=Mesorhizobium australicum TaxID=536018 RepID=A0A1X7MU20_9HYPH|nr:tRNA uridine-5-carboxymethylaminomethyl(34) synthesis GTPase MnmE [Mesorhizobium australicum]SMH28315.1 tRNA modification GTPase trmE [Mesorhizobium australicum]